MTRPLQFTIGPDAVYAFEGPLEDVFARACGLAFHAGMLEAALEQIAEAGNACRCGYSPCGCGTRMAEAAEDALGPVRVARAVGRGTP